LRIFISAVTSEFGKARDALASDLRARGHEVIIQSDFKQSPDSETLLGNLADYIRDCHAVVCIVGKRCGACPPARAAQRLKGVLPDHIKEASYTQWEFFLARYFKRRPYLYIASDSYEPDRDAAASDRTGLQNAYLEFLKAEGAHYTGFSDANELRIAVLRDEPKIVANPAPSSQSAPMPVILPYPSIGDLFKGRDEFMQRLHESLTRVRGGRTAIVSQALYGLGGIGKTRAAVEYAWAHADDYTALLFAVAETPEALRRNLAALAGALVPQLDTTDDAARLAAVLDWLKVNPGWFLILDNVDSKPALAEVEHLLGGLIGGHVIITSRLADFSANFQPLELDVLTPEDATSFLLARTEGRRRAESDDALKACELARDLGQLALALEQAAAFIAKRRLTFAQYMEQWRSNRDEVLAWFDATVTSYPRAVAVTWQTSVARLSEGGRRLLERLAWLAPEKMPESLLEISMPSNEISTLLYEIKKLEVETQVESPTAPGSRKVKSRKHNSNNISRRLATKRRQDRAQSSGDLREAFDDLAAYSLVMRDAKGPFFLVHRLVQDVTRRSLIGETRRRRILEVLFWIISAFKGAPDDARNWPTLEALAPHARAILSHADGDGIVSAGLTSHLGSFLDAKALYAEAEPLLRRALALDEEILGPNDPSVANHLNNLANLLQDTNRLTEAESMFRRAVAIDKRHRALDPRSATRLTNLGVLLRIAGRPAEAEPLQRRAISILEKTLGPDHVDVAAPLNNLASLLQSTNRFREAEPLIRRSIGAYEKFERRTGRVHPKYALALTNLGLLLASTDRHVEAEKSMRRALAIEEKSLGSDHRNLTKHLDCLAQLLQETGRLDESERLRRRALAIDEKNLGPSHRKVAMDLSDLAGVLQAANRLTEAEPLKRRALALGEQSLGADDPDLAIFFYNLAQLLQYTNRQDEAEPLIRRALAISEKSSGLEHPNVARCCRLLGELLQSTGRIDEAESLMRRALTIDERSLGPNHLDVVADLSNLSGLLQAMGRLDEAELPMHDAVEILVKISRQAGSAHAQLPAILRKYILLLNAMGKGEEEIKTAVEMCLRYQTRGREKRRRRLPSSPSTHPRSRPAHSPR
jgi:tetratricopeptide (TPR) repeat protein